MTRLRHLVSLRNAGLVDTRRDRLWDRARLARAHDRMTDLTAPGHATVVAAVGQALAEADVVQRDTARLKNRPSCRLVAPSSLVELAENIGDSL